MAKLTILEYPDPRLRTKAAPVERVDDLLRRQIDGDNLHCDDVADRQHGAAAQPLAGVVLVVHGHFHQHRGVGSKGRKYYRGRIAALPDAKKLERLIRDTLRP